MSNIDLSNIDLNTTFTANVNDTINSGWYFSDQLNGSINIEGENADIVINGKSLSNTINKLEQRLNLLTVNPELETEWDELRELGERYRELERKCKEKSEMWGKLKQLPPSDL